MLVLYILYIVLMYFNQAISGWAINKVSQWKGKWRQRRAGKSQQEEAESLLAGAHTCQTAEILKRNSYEAAHIEDKKNGKLDISGSFTSDYSQHSVRGEWGSL